MLSHSTGGISGWVVLRPGHTRPSCASPDAQRVPGISPRDMSSTPPARPDHGACLQALPDGPWGLSCSWSRNAVAGGIGDARASPAPFLFEELPLVIGTNSRACSPTTKGGAILEVSFSQILFSPPPRGPRTQGPQSDAGRSPQGPLLSAPRAAGRDPAPSRKV